ncbi:hypothetical protein ID875_13360 [Streptomyces globisporus]|uniref:Uncharacterized protein n=1 Tax=Streptomyces globisporus TaxID=1908 RepID=A0A927BLM5_STRGL|nr:hypothetical protein [Streptomyces globisporus]
MVGLTFHPIQMVGDIDDGGTGRSEVRGPGYAGGRTAVPAQLADVGSGSPKARTAVARIEPGTAPGAQGDVIDIISLVLGNGFAAASLMVSLASWRASRSQTSRITIELPDGRSIVISQNSTDTTALLDSLTDETENRDDSPS